MVYFFRMPSGPYGIGYIPLHVHASRELMIYVYYPTTYKSDKPTMLYDADALACHKAFVHAQTSIPLGMLTSWDAIKTYAQPGIPIADDKQQYPVILVTHGAGPMVQHYTWLLEELASQGYIAIGINHTYLAAITRFPDDRVIKSLLPKKKKLGRHVASAWKQEQLDVCVNDINLVLQKLEQLQENDTFFQARLDLDRLGIIGHSFGGDIALRAAQTYQNIKAAIDLDGGERTFDYLLKTNFMTSCLVVQAEKSHNWSGESGKHDLIKLESFCKNYASVVTLYVMPGAGHGIFTDLPFFLRSTLFTRVASYVVDLDLAISATKACTMLEKICFQINDFFFKQFNIKK